MLKKSLLDAEVQICQAYKALDRDDKALAKVELARAQNAVCAARHQLHEWINGNTTSFFEDAKESVERALHRTGLI